MEMRVRGAVVRFEDEGGHRRIVAAPGCKTCTGPGGLLSDPERSTA
jgi:hypothetical protein